MEQEQRADQDADKQQRRQEGVRPGPRDEKHDGESGHPEEHPQACRQAAPPAGEPHELRLHAYFSGELTYFSAMSSIRESWERVTRVPITQAPISSATSGMMMRAAFTTGSFTKLRTSVSS